MGNNRIAIIGSVGIPGNYGGFETLVENLTKELGNKHSITVYCSSRSYKEKQKFYNGAALEYIPLRANGIQSIAYDIISLFCAARKHDTILVLGVSGCIILPIFRFLFKRKKLVINIDGLEHRREKWNKPVKMFLKYSEKSAIRYADKIIADNKVIQQYIKEEYGKESRLIAYGGNHVKLLALSAEIRPKYSLPEEYAFEVCRIEPENNIDLILQAFCNISLSLVIVGNWHGNKYGKALKEKYQEYSNLILIDPIYDQNILDQIRSNCKVYIHGHSAGGTNPSLVEAMSLGLPVFAYNVEYNRATTFEEAFYFSTMEELKDLILSGSVSKLSNVGEKMLEVAGREYTWQLVAKQYLALFSE